MKRVNYLVIAMLLLVAVLSVQAEEPAGETFVFLPIMTQPLDTSGAPPHSTSFYITDISEIAMADLGCELALRTAYFDNFTAVSMLHFGQPWEDSGEFGVRYFTPENPFASTTTIEAGVRAFALQYVLCSIAYDSPYIMILGIGVSNFGSTHVTQAHGEAWGQMIHNIATMLEGTSADGRVLIAGSGDLEPGFNTPENTHDWITGFFIGTDNNYDLYNFGAAGGCPETEPPPGAINCGTKKYPEWTLDDMRLITARQTNMAVIPEIYYTNGRHARQWHYVAVHVAETGIIPLTFAGTLTQYGACEQRPTAEGCTAENPYLKNRPEVGWAQLFFEIADDPRVAQQIPYASDLRWQGEKGANQ